MAAAIKTAMTMSTPYHGRDEACTIRTVPKGDASSPSARRGTIDTSERDSAAEEVS